MGLTDIILRVGLAMAVGLIVGWEREKSHRPAGLRTHMLVCIGAAVVTLVGEYSFVKYGANGTDVHRLAAQVISGIGFLGAGTIIKEGNTVKGLTSAAGIWAVACLGIAAGSGFYDITLVGTGAIMLTLTLFEFLKTKTLKKDKNELQN